ncbi:MAG: hypothetical protein DI630_04625 [Gordonia sp. (in: high G+C Gram-positive bacteria)]|nr:MAG: hypothetical protein DI630_04625 [Gordonia sp. (in: high G+C Gram-positive bacteria)]
MLGAVSGCCSVHVYVGDASAGYIQGLQLEGSQWQIYSSYKKWLWAAYRFSSRGRSALVDNAGEINGNRYSLKRSISLVPLVELIRLKGGAVCRIGAGIRTGRGFYIQCIRLALRRYTFLAWRDPETARFFGRGSVVPDWAFDDRPLATPDGKRHLVVISLRFDRGVPSASWIEGVRSYADMYKLDIVTAAQVRRDQPLADALASLLHGRSVGWSSEGINAQESRLRNLYSSAAVTISDRLHVVVIALSQGSEVCAPLHHEDVKLGRSLQPANLSHLVSDVRQWSASEVTSFIESCTTGAGELGRGTETFAASARESVQRTERSLQLLAGVG